MDNILDNDFDLDTVDFSVVKNNGFNVETMDFSDVDKHVGVKSIEDIDSREEYESNKKIDYIELNGNAISKTNPVIDTITYNALRGSYTISYHELGNSKTEEHFISKKDLSENRLKIKEKRTKWGKTSNKLNRIDMNLYTALSRFDAKHNSNCAGEYLNDNSSYITNYYMSSIFKNKEYSLLEKFNLIRTANKQKRYRKATTDNPRGLYAIPALTSFALILGILGISAPGNKDKSSNSDANSKTIVKEIDSDEINFNSEVDDLVTDNKIEEKKKTELDAIKNESRQEPEIIETVDSHIYDSFVLNNTDLEYSPIEDIKHVNTDSLDYVDNYKISLVSVYDGNTILCNEKIDNIDNKTIDELIKSLNKEYGVGTKKYVNWNGFDKDGNQILEYVGWSNLENLKVKDISYSDEQIQKLNKAKERLLSLENSDSSKIYQKRYINRQRKR